MLDESHLIQTRLLTAGLHFSKPLGLLFGRHFQLLRS